MNVGRRATLFASIPATSAAAEEIVFPRYNMRLPQPRQHVIYFEINACHGNKFENGCQTACQLQSVLLALLVWHYLIFSLKENQPADVLLGFLLFVEPPRLHLLWEQRTLRACWLFCDMNTVFFTPLDFSLMADIEPSGTFPFGSLSFLADTLSNMAVSRPSENS